MDRVSKHRGRRAEASPSSESLDTIVSASAMSGSLGSDAGGHIRRALDSPPVNLGLEIRGLEIPHGSSAGQPGGRGSNLAESAYSVLHKDFGSHNNSQNGSSN